jgi:hypothetical protein
MRTLLTLLVLLAACGDDCRPLPTCVSLGWSGTGPLACSRTGSPARCAYQGEACVVGDGIVCEPDDLATADE